MSRIRRKLICSAATTACSVLISLLHKEIKKKKRLTNSDLDNPFLVILSFIGILLFKCIKISPFISVSLTDRFDIITWQEVNCEKSMSFGRMRRWGGGGGLCSRTPEVSSGYIKILSVPCWKVGIFLSHSSTLRPLSLPSRPPSVCLSLSFPQVIRADKTFSTFLFVSPPLSISP